MALSLAAAPISASAQQPPDEDAEAGDDTPDVLWESEQPSGLDPAKLGMTPIGDPANTYALLTAPDRCAVGRAEKERIPCALLSYAPPGTLPEDFADSLRPVFKVEGPDRIWTFLDSGLARAPIGALISTTDLRDARAPRDQAYQPTAIVGFRENSARCAREGWSSCLPVHAFRGDWADPAVLTAGCVDEIWNRRGGPTGPGEQSRCRYSRNPN